MTRSYFPQSKESWLDISREERLFCAHLYEFLREKGNSRKFIDSLDVASKDVASGEVEVSQDTLRKDNYEVRYEVCFYRDLARAYDRKELVRKPSQSLPSQFPRKRTFDLCLFGQKHIVIVEAKAHSSFNSEQLEWLGCEKKKIKRLFEELGVESQDVEIAIVCLASSKLFCGEHPKQKKHTQKVKDHCDFLTTWKSLSQLNNNDPEFSRVMKRADCCYNK